MVGITLVENGIVVAKGLGGGGWGQGSIPHILVSASLPILCIKTDLYVNYVTLSMQDV